ncbi:MAG: hypothetical protein RLZZ227_220 [Pseudomonadota bacterium]|jgi:hypothetical protein
MFPRWKKHLVTLLLLVYTSQSIAALLMPCEMATGAGAADAQLAAALPMDHEMSHAMHQDAEHDHALMGHSTKHAATSSSGVVASVMNSGSDTSPDSPHSTASHADVDCCGLMGHCPQGSCTLPGASADPVQVSGIVGIPALHFHPLQNPASLTSTHFRPPISG